MYILLFKPAVTNLLPFLVTAMHDTDEDLWFIVRIVSFLSKECIPIVLSKDPLKRN